MHFSKTVDNDGYIRIEEDCGAAVTLFVDDEYAEIISIFVPRAEQLQGLGTEIIKVAEQVAQSREAKVLEVDYAASIRGMTEVLTKSGFSIYESATVWSINTGKLLSQKEVQNSLKKKYADAIFLSLEELAMKQWDAFHAVLSAFSIPLSSADLARYSQSMSGVVFDDAGMVQSFILCSESSEGVHVDFLCSTQKKNDSYMMAVLQGMLMEVYASGGAKRYPNITALCVDESMRKFVESIFSGRPDDSGSAIYAKKDLIKKTKDVIDIDDDPDEDMVGEWRREIGKVPIQQNIGWKVLWYRNRKRKKTVKSEIEPQISNAGTGKAAKKGGNITEFPHELMDPLDIDYGYDKEEDETGDLENTDIVRITAENLNDFRKIIPNDALQNLPRPMHRGLALKNGDKASYLIYELKNTDTDEETRSEIHWLDLGSSGEELLKEYSNEIKKVRTIKSVLETDEDNQSVLVMAGFEAEERESQILSVKVEEFKSLPFASKKQPDYVRRLRDIGERQFKRGVGTCMIYNRKGLLDDLAFLPMDWFELDVSSVVITDGRVSGMLLMHQLPSEQLMVDLLFSSGGDAQLDILRMVTHSIQAAVAKYPKKTPVILKRHNAVVKAISDRLFPGKKGETVLYCERKER